MVDVDAEGHHAYGRLEARREEAVAVEARRHPHLVHLVPLPHPLLREAVHFQHRVPDARAPLVAGKDVALAIDDGDLRPASTPAFRHDVQQVVAGVLRLAHGERCAGPVDVLIGHAHALSVERVQDLAAAHGVARGEVQDRLPREVAHVARLERACPLSSERRAALLEDAVEDVRGVARRAVLAMEKRHGPAAHRPKALLLCAQAEVRVLEVRDVVLREAGQNVEQLAL